MFEELKQIVFEANQQLPKHGLITFTWGNVSQVDKTGKYVAIKPSGVKYENMKYEDIVIVDLDGNIVDGKLKPSSDLATHLEIYKKYPEIKGIVHTHSRWATTMAQSKLDVTALGTTHGDYFYGDIPCTRTMTPEEIAGEYEKETGLVIIETFEQRGISPVEIPGVLVASHGPFTFGKDAEDAVHNAVVLEEISFMAWHNMMIGKSDRMQQELLDKHYLRKHGKGAYYGQG